MRIKIRPLAPRIIFTPHNRISPLISGKQPKTSEIHLSIVTSLRLVKYTNILPGRKFHCWTRHIGMFYRLHTCTCMFLSIFLSGCLNMHMHVSIQLSDRLPFTRPQATTLVVLFELETKDT